MLCLFTALFSPAPWNLPSKQQGLQEVMESPYSSLETDQKDKKHTKEQTAPKSEKDKFSWHGKRSVKHFKS